jgi:hypothetical protein
MNVPFDHRPLHPLDALRSNLRAIRFTASGSRAASALAGSIALTICASGILDVRLAGIRSDVSADLVRRSRTAADAAPAQRTLRRIGELQTHVVELERARDSGDVAANDIIRLGNALPSHVWFGRFRRDGSDLILDGGAGSVDAVGRALLALNSGRSRTQLIALKDAARPDAASDIRYSVRIAPR